MIQSVDHVALLPAYLAAGTAVLVLLTDLIAGPGRVGQRLVPAVGVLGALGTVLAAVLVGNGDDRATFCVSGTADCSYVADETGAVVAVLFAGLTAAVLLLSTPILGTGAPADGRPALLARTGLAPVGEYCFLLSAAMTGGVALGYAGDLITLIVALETLTLPLYLLVGMRRTALASAEAAVTFFVVSVVSTAVTLLGAGLLYALTGTVHLHAMAGALAARPELHDVPLTAAAVVLVLVGLAFKVAAVPFHAWAPATYDGAPLPVAAYLSTASKLGGVIALLYVGVGALRPWLDVAGPALATLAVLTMTIGNLLALRQRRMVRLLAWSSVAQAGYIIAPLGALAAADGRTDEALTAAITATIGYAIFYVLLELVAFGSVIALRAPGSDGGELADYRGAARRSPWLGSALVLAMVGLAGLPPGLAGLFAKVVVIRSLLDGQATWLAVVVALNAVVGLAYYIRVAALLFAPAPAAETGPEPGAAREPVPAGVTAGPVPAAGGAEPAPSAGAAGPVSAAGAAERALAAGAGTAAAELAGAPVGAGASRPRLSWTVGLVVAAAVAGAVLVGFAPQLVLDAAELITLH